MTTLTLDKSRNALAVLAWRKGMVRKPFANLAAIHAASRQQRSPVIIQSRALTKAQSLGVKKKRR